MAWPCQIAKKYLATALYLLWAAVFRYNPITRANREDDVGSNGSQDPARSCIS